MTMDRYNIPVLQQLCDSKEEAEKEMENCKSCWADDVWWIEEGVSNVTQKCKGCQTPEAYERSDAHGITTGIWCEECYNSSKYPYRKDRYPTMETHGYGEYLDDNY